MRRFIRRTIPQRLSDVSGRDHVIRREISNRSSDTKDAVVSTRREVERFHGGADHFSGLAIDTTVRKQPSPRRLCVARCRRSDKPRALDGATPLDTSANRHRRFAVAGALERFRRHRRKRDVHVDAISKCTGQPCAVLHDFRLTARTYTSRMAEVTTLTLLCCPTTGGSSPPRSLFQAIRTSSNTSGTIFSSVA
jgi:hypothetical protein